MSATAPQQLSVWIARHSILVWVGIVLSLFFAIPLIFNPDWILGLFNIPPENSLWPRFAGLMLLIVTIYYIPPTIDLERYRANAWIAIFPSRSLGATFFFLAVFAFDQPAGFIAGVVLDGTVGALTLYCLIRVTALERQRKMEGGTG